jgi:hypothetical protein
MRTRKEILEYLQLDQYEEEWVSEIVETAQRIEQEYEEELLEGSVGYGLYCDFVNTPWILEDCDIEKIAEVNGIVIYKKLEEY